MIKMKVDVALVPVAVPIEAKPGHHIMVMDGKAVGVFTGKVPSGVVEHPALPAPEKKPVGRPKGIPARGNQKLGSLTHRSPEERERLDGMILETVRANPGITTTELFKVLGWKTGSNEAKNIRSHYARLERNGLIRREQKDGNWRLGMNVYPTEKAGDAAA